MIPMQTNLSDERDEGVLAQVHYLVGNSEILEGIKNVSPRIPFDKQICDFLATLSKEIMKDATARQYSDVMTFAFWIRKASVYQMKEEYEGCISRRAGCDVSYRTVECAG